MGHPGRGTQDHRPQPLGRARRFGQQLADLKAYVRQHPAEHVLPGLADMFLLFLLPLVAAGLLALPALRTCPRDVATAAASIEAVDDRDA